MCRLPTVGRNLLKDQLVNVVANALYYNPVLALQQLQAQGRTQAFFSTWFQVSSCCCPNESVSNLTGVADSLALFALFVTASNCPARVFEIHWQHGNNMQPSPLCQ